MKTVVPLADRVRHLVPSGIAAAIRAGQAPGVVSLSVGSPGEQMVPSSALAQAYAEVCADHGARALGYGPPEGHRELRAFVAARQAGRGAAVTADDVIITSGSQQALDLIGRLLLDQGDVVVVEAPSYPGALDAFAQFGVEFVPVPMDEQGLRTDDLARVLRSRKVRLIYTVPNFQNPSGRTMSAGRRRELVALAQRYGVPVVEDDAYAELSLGGPLPAPLHALDDSGLVISIGSMSKVLCPGLRVGWLLAAKPLLDSIVLLKERADLLTSAVAQLVALRLCADGALDRHLAAVRPLYLRQRDVMLAALDWYLGEHCTFTKPGGGFFVWLGLPSGLEASKVADTATSAGVCVMPGTAFHTDGSGHDALRLSYAGGPVPLIQEGVRRLTGAIQTELGITNVAPPSELAA